MMMVHTFTRSYVHTSLVFRARFRLVGMPWHANSVFIVLACQKNFGVCEDPMRKKYSILTKITMIIQYNFLLIAYTICRDHVH